MSPTQQHVTQGKHWKCTPVLNGLNLMHSLYVLLNYSHSANFNINKFCLDKPVWGGLLKAEVTLNIDNSQTLSLTSETLSTLSLKPLENHSTPFLHLSVDDYIGCVASASWPTNQCQCDSFGHRPSWIMQYICKTSLAVSQLKLTFCGLVCLKGVSVSQSCPACEEGRKRDTLIPVTR